MKDWEYALIFIAIVTFFILYTFGIKELNKDEEIDKTENLKIGPDWDKKK